MKKFIKLFTVLFAFAIIFFFSFRSFVSAYTTVSIDIPFNFYNESSLSDDVVKTIYNNVYKNKSIIDFGYSSDNSTLCIYESSNTIFIYIQKSDTFVDLGSGCFLNANLSGFYPTLISYSFTNTSSSISDLLNHSFSLNSISYPNSGYYLFNVPVFDSNRNRYYIANIKSSYSSIHDIVLNGGYSDTNPDTSKPLAFFYNYVPAFNPIISPLYDAVYSLSIEKEEFIKWLIDNEKYVEIADSLVENRVSGFVDIFQRYGSNTKSFAYNVKQFFEFIGIGQTVSDYESVLEKTRSLYREYQQYVRFQLMEHYNNKVKDTLNIKPVTNDNNTTLITDADSDTVVIRLLRDILRSLIALPVNIGDLIRTLEVKVDGLDNSVIIANDGGSSDLSSLWTYSSNDFDDDLLNFSLDIAEVQQIPLQYLTNINENPLMPEKTLTDKENLTVNIPNISGFTVSDSGKSFSTQTTSYVISSNDYPWLDSLVKKIKRFSGILLILAYLVSLRYRLPEIVRGE